MAVVAPPARAITPRPLLARSIAAALLLCANLVVALMLFVAHWQRLTLVTQLRANLPVEESVLIASDDLIRVWARVSFPAFVVTAVVFLAWLYRAAENLRAFRSEPLDFTPGQAVRSFFIPFVNLVRPFQVMREVWQGSDPEIPPLSATGFRTADTSPLVLVWWLLYIGFNALGTLVFRASQTGGPGLTTLMSMARFSMAMHLVELGAAAAAITLVFLIERRQTALAVALEHPLPKD
jgi:hypothetical protein